MCVIRDLQGLLIREAAMDDLIRMIRGMNFRIAAIQVGTEDRGRRTDTVSLRDGRPGGDFSFEFEVQENIGKYQMINGNQRYGPNPNAADSSRCAVAKMLSLDLGRTWSTLT